MENNLIFLDGAMGTMLQANGLQPGEIPEIFGLQHPDVVRRIHRAYIDAGSNIIYANTFGANAKKLKGSGYRAFDVVKAAVTLAKQEARGDAKVAVDIGPIGELLEPNGYLRFEDAYEIFKEMVVAGEEAGGDLIVFETMSDLMEVKAGILAAKEHTKLPVFVTMSFEETHRTFTGCSAKSFALLCERMHVDAIGVNCSLGPDEILPIMEEIAEICDLPLIVKANAGLPDPLTNTYDIDAKTFAEKMENYASLGIRYVGGCCGTSPEFIKALQHLSFPERKAHREKKSYACTATRCIELSGVHVVGERINPTGNKRMKQALIDKNMDEILHIAMEQVEAGADILDVNVGLPGCDEKEMMVKVIKELQGVIDVPLQIDSTNPEVIEAALRIYNGVAIVNSVNGEKESRKNIFPLIDKYGANVVGLTLDEHGIPEKGEDRYAIGKRIIESAKAYGIESHRVFLDCLTLTVSAQQEGALETLKALRMVKEQLHVQTMLGVSNISFGLPRRLLLNSCFLTLAMQAGLTMPIINPNQNAMMDAVRSYRVLSCLDAHCEAYIESYADTKPVSTSTEAKAEMSVQDAIMKGLKEETRHLAKALLLQKEPLAIVDEELIPALDLVGERYEKKEIYLPQLINAATASQAAFEELKHYMRTHGNASITKGKILLATVRGDVHDIGKNIVKVVLENYGYQIYDLGKDVPAELIVETAIKEDIHLIGLSALMTTTLPAMKETVEKLHDSKHPCKIMVGGAVVSEEYAREIHADYYAKDAKESADIAKEVLG